MKINGKKVVDATKPATINITKHDTTAGDNKNPSSCAAARAAVRDFECVSARVHIGRVYIEEAKRWVRYKTPDALRTEIVAFDKGGSFQPGEYVLNPPAPSARLARSGSATGKTKKKSSRTKSPRKLIAKIKRHEVTGIRPKGANR